jgi:uroporphyrinogen-III synthase
MTVERPTLLITRPEPQARRFADDFRSRFGADWPVVLSPLTAIRFVEDAILPSDISSVVFTSENAVKAYLRQQSGAGKLAWCVGDRTAKCAREGGFDTRSGSGDAAGLVRTILASGARGPMLYPRGVDTAFDMKNALETAGIELISVAVYRQVGERPTDEALALLQGSAPVLLPLFSPRGARAASATFAGCPAPLMIASLSQAVREATAGLSAVASQSASRPSSAAMLEALQFLIARVKKVEANGNGN